VDVVPAYENELPSKRAFTVASDAWVMAAACCDDCHSRDWSW
jgi:hypothetical protein